MYVRNRMPMKALDGRTPYEVLYDMKLELETRVHSGYCVPSSDRERI